MIERREKPLQKVGFFHWGTDDSCNSAELLYSALRDAAQECDLGDSLIVVPEAFNIQNYYQKTSRCDGCTRGALVEMSRKFGVSLVVGLVDEEGGTRGFSCAYLVDDGICRALARKQEDDGWRNYRPCDPGWCDPIVHRGLGVAALICMDAAEEDPTKKLRQGLIEKIKGLGVCRTVLCVPARMTSLESRLVAKGWGDLFVVIANGSCARPSVIQLPGKSSDEGVGGAGGDCYIHCVALPEQQG